MFESPEFWVALAFVVFVVAVFRPLRRASVGALDARAARIRAEIEEAQTLREEAQKLLSDYKRKQRDALKEAEEILAQARVGAGHLREQAQQELEAALRRREQMTLDKIAQAEAEALQEVRGHAIEVALAATAKLLAANLDRGRGQALIDSAIRDLPGKLH